ncbi:MAG: hypothetical protein PHO63_00505 [Bacilli bacterium]|nr:hypothetical protein [Bacilli bacterium]MDD4809206.1 hypothetical protein [Bacilli bacterium]
MREGVGSVFLYNLIIVFIVLIFSFLAATLSYYKAFKVNKQIVNIIERNEGYNPSVKDEIRDNLRTIGYKTYAKGQGIYCKSRKDGGVLVLPDANYPYCIYFFNNDGNAMHYSYGVMTYITFDFPFFNMFLKIPIYNKTNRIFRF